MALFPFAPGEAVKELSHDGDLETVEFSHTMADIMNAFFQSGLSTEKMVERVRENSKGTAKGDGRYTEIYQLWVDPDYRRRGLATQLKRQVEVERVSLTKQVDLEDESV